MPKVTIIGAGNVGATAAHVLATKNCTDIVLIDVVEGLPQGKALDLMHMRSVEHFDTIITGTNDYSDTVQSDVVVITAGIARKPGMTREDLLGVNSGIMRSCISQAMDASPDAIVVCVTNPLDVMTYLAYKASGLASSRLMGMGGVLDSARLTYAICEKLRCDPASVEAWAVGPHGDGMVCWPRFTKINGVPLTDLLSEEEIDHVVSRCINGGAEVVGYLKTGSAFYAPGASIARMVEAILKDTGEMMSVCAYLNGQYCITDVYMNTPVRLGRTGVKEVVEFPLNESELAAYQAGAESVKASLQLLNV